MSFTSDVKQELSLKSVTGGEERAELSALIQMTSSISVSSRGMAIAVTTENAPVSRAIYRMMKGRYTVNIETSVRRRMNLNKNLIYSMKIYGPVTEILKDLCIYSARGLQDRPLQKVVQKDPWARAYLAGAFMADGSVNSPQTSGYHLEIKACNEKHAEFLIDLMARFDIPARSITRRSKHVVYLKASDRISDFLRVCGADRCLLEFENERISRDFSEASITFWSASKAFNLAGLQTAAVICKHDAARERIKHFLNVHGTGELNPFGFIAASAAWGKSEEWLDELREYLSGNYRTLLDFVRLRLPTLRVAALEATYLAWVDATALGFDSTALAARLEYEAKVKFSQGAIYGEPHGSAFLRINLACPRITLMDALERFAKWIEAHSGRCRQS